MDKYEIANILKAAAEGIEGYSSNKTLQTENQMLKDRVKALIKALAALCKNTRYAYTMNDLTADKVFSFFIEALSNSDSIDDSLVEDVYNKIAN